MRELDFLKHVPNHWEFSQKLKLLVISPDQVQDHARQITTRWFHLGEIHLRESAKLLDTGCERAALSRAYYSVYNSSKAVRYQVNGIVSLKGDDHHKASQLPDDFPDSARWAQIITQLYENRLRADYDNWSTTKSEFSITAAEAVKRATEFRDEAKKYLNSKFGVFL